MSELAKNLNLNSQQAEALTLKKQGIIAAGAGSGKTQTLSALVCRDLIEDNLNASDVLVCTFTRAAASNLTQRINKQLSLLNNKKDISQLYVGTIDALCSRILKENSMEEKTEIVPGFKVADERSLLLIKQKAFEKALTKLSEQELLLLGTIADLDSISFMKTVSQVVDNLRVSLQGKAQNVSFETPLENNDLLKQSVLQKMNDFIKNDLPEKTVSKIEEDIVALENEEISLFTNGAYGLRKTNSLFEHLEKIKEELNHVKNIIVDEQMFDIRQAAIHLVKQFAVYFEKEKKKKNVLDFLDLALKVNSLNIQPFKRIYIDEAQDTNYLQIELLSKLLSHEENSLLIAVGDASQSIYGFRNADVEAFRQQAAESEEQVFLNMNYRSQPSLMKAINVVCSRIPDLEEDLILMDSAGEQKDEENSPSLQWLRIPTEDSPSVELEADIVVDYALQRQKKLGLQNKEICVLCASNDDCGVYAEAFRKRNVPALLIQKRGLLAREESKDLLAYLALIAKENNEEALIRVLSSPFVALTDYQLYSFAADRSYVTDEDGNKKYEPLFPLALAASPFFAEKHKKILKKIKGKGPSAIAQIIVEEYDFLLALEIDDPTGSKRRNIEKLISLLRQLEYEHGPATSTILKRLEIEQQAGIDEGQDASIPHNVDAVQIMTIHNAKGDEFPLVVIGRTSKQSQSRFPIIIADKGTIGINTGKGFVDRTAKEYLEKEKQLKTEEEKRLFYVALTRGEREVIIAASGKIKKDGMPSWRGMASWLFENMPEIDESSLQGNNIILKMSGHGVRGSTPGSCYMKVITLTEPENNPQENKKEKETSEEIPELHETSPLPLFTENISYSSLASWNKCSLRRHLEFENKLASNPWGHTKEIENFHFSTGARKMGLLIHDILANYNYKENTSLKTFRNEYSRAISRLPDDNPAKTREMIDKLEKNPILEKIQQANKIETEKHFTLPILNFKANGSIDLLAKYDDHWMIIDWKTGVDEEELFDEDYTLQRKLYSLACLYSPNPPQKIKTLTLHLENNKTEENTFLLKEKEALLKELQQEIQKIMTKEIKPAAHKKQPFCNDCPGQRLICPVSKH